MTPLGPPRRGLRTAFAGRGFMLFPAAAFAVHQLRYELAYGSRSGAALSAQGHGYLNSLAPWVAVLAALACGSYVMRLARAVRGRGGAGSRRAFGALWLVASAGLLVVYALQELLEGLFAAGHPGGFAGVFGHGGWWAIVLSVAAGLIVAFLLRLGSALIELVASRPRRLVAPATAPRRRSVATGSRPAPLASAAAGRAPPRVFCAAL